MCKNNSFDGDKIKGDAINVFKQYGIDDVKSF